MKKLLYIEAIENDNLGMSHGPFNPEAFENGFVDTNIVTGLKFNYSDGIDVVNEDTKKAFMDLGYDKEEAEKLAASHKFYYSKTYFIGDIKNFEDIEDVFADKENAKIEYAEKKFAVTYSEDGKIKSVKVIDTPAKLDDIAEFTYTAKNKEELARIFKRETGKDYLLNKEEINTL